MEDYIRVLIKNKTISVIVKNSWGESPKTTTAVSVSICFLTITEFNCLKTDAINF
jgi:hypothetical protein